MNREQLNLAVSRVASDFRIALRSIRREWASSLFIILTLAIGIGANAALFGVVDRLLLTGPERISDPRSVHRLYWTGYEGSDLTTASVFDYAAFEALRHDASSITDIAGYEARPGTLGRGRDARKVTIGYVTGDYFATLGTPALFGRVLDADSASAEPDIAVISWGLWQSAFGGARDVVGRMVALQGHRYRVVGVMPQGFTGAETTTTDVWLPAEGYAAGILPPGWRTGWGLPWLLLVVRQRPGVSVQVMNAELTSIFRHAYAGADPAARATTLTAEPLTRNPTGMLSPEQSVSLWLACLALVALAIAALNVSNLLAARAMRRRAAFGIRVALGASRRNIVGLFIAEGILLALGGGVTAMGVAYAVGVPIRRELPPEIAWTSPIIDVRVAVLALCSVMFIGVAVAIIPARRIFGTKLNDLLQVGARQRVSGRATSRAITAVQSALSMVLLVAAGLFLHSMLIARSINLGFEPAHVTRALVRWPRLPGSQKAAQQAEWARRTALLEGAVQRFRADPDVQSATVASGFPLGGAEFARLEPTSGPMRGIPISPVPYLYAVSDQYFETIGTRILAGRAIDASDRPTSAPVVVVSQSLALQLWPGQSALGQCMRQVADTAATAPCARVVGIAADTRNGIRSEEKTQIYAPLAQSPPDNLWLLVRSTTPSARLAPTIRGTLTELDPTIDDIDVASLESGIERTLRPWELGTMMFGLMGLLAFVIAAVGLYGVVSYDAISREPELGIRRALGASPANIVRLVIRTSVGASVIGVLFGGAVAVAGTRYIRSLLYTGLGSDPAVVAIVAAGLVLTAVAAAAIPALRLLRRSPADALRAG